MPPCRVLEALSAEGSVSCVGAELSKKIGALSHRITDPPATTLVRIYTHRDILSPSHSPALLRQKLSRQPWGDKSSSLWTSCNSDRLAAKLQVVVAQASSTVMYWLADSLPHAQSPHSLHPQCCNL